MIAVADNINDVVKLVSPLDLAKLNAKIYASATGWLNYWQYDDVVVGHTQVGDADVLVLRGSATTEDWLRDGLAIPKWHPQLGFCHAGFLAGMDDVFAEVRGAVANKTVITGHSLGGARARILAGLFAYNGVPINQLCTFGSPKPAFVNLARIIQKSGMDHDSYRNRNDIVPTLPLTIELVCDFVHTEGWTTLNAAPADTNLEPLRDHSIDLYVEGLTL